MSSRKRRSSDRLQQDDGTPEEEVVIQETELEELPQRKRRSTSARAATPSGGAAGNGAAEDSNGGAAAAAAAAAGGGPPPRDRQERVQFSQQEADTMMEAIKRLEEEGEAARDKAAAMNLPQTLVDAAVGRVVRFLLFRHHEKPGVPIKRQDINDVISGTAGVVKGSKGSRGLAGVVLPLVMAKVATVFGMELKELKKGDTGGAAAAAAAAGADGSTPAAAAAAGGAATAAAGTQTYKLLSMLPVNLLERYAQHDSENQERGFMTIVLALLQLKQYKMEEDELWRHLQQFGLDKDDQDAGVPFGKHPTKILETMEHGRYLLKVKEAAPNTERGVAIRYEWGEAAYSEFGGGQLEGIVTQFLQAGEGGGS